jgi:hypothetical protein
MEFEIFVIFSLVSFFHLSLNSYQQQSSVETKWSRQEKGVNFQTNYHRKLKQQKQTFVS